MMFEPGSSMTTYRGSSTPGFVLWHPYTWGNFKLDRVTLTISVEVPDGCAGSTQQHWPFPGGKELVGYAYLFTHPGEVT